MASELGVGIIGAGSFGGQHARAISELPGVRLVAASARRAERLSRFTAEYGGTGYPDYRELLADPAVDAVCIVLPNDLHAEPTIEGTSVATTRAVVNASLLVLMFNFVLSALLFRS